MSNTPLFDAVSEYARKRPVRLHMPGHKGISPFPMLCDIVSLDVTELEPTDDLFCADGAIAEAEKLATALYKSSATVFCAGGSTLCIQTMLRLAFPEGGKLILARNCHKSAVNACSLLDIESIWIYQSVGGDCPYPRIRVDAVRKALGENPDARAVMITSPDYYGVMCEIREIAQACHEAGKLLIVDNAHGAHLIAFEGVHPNVCGADIVCDSAHKTLQSLTGGAFLHINNGAFSADEAKAAMSVFGSSSPSYLIMTSLDLARAALEDRSREFVELSGKLEAAAAALAPYDIRRTDGDPCKLTLDFLEARISGYTAEKILRENGIYAEYADSRFVVLMPSPQTKNSELSKTVSVIASAVTGASTGNTSSNMPQPCLVDPVFTPRQAFLTQTETVEIRQSVGRICGRTVAVCPPAFCLAVAGERIRGEHIRLFEAYGIDKLSVIK